MRGSPVDVDEIYIRICLCVKAEPFDAGRKRAAVNGPGRLVTPYVPGYINGTLSGILIIIRMVVILANSVAASRCAAPIDGAQTAR